jgi:hypothetical protein
MIVTLVVTAPGGETELPRERIAEAGVVVRSPKLVAIAPGPDVIAAWLTITPIPPTTASSSASVNSIMPFIGIIFLLHSFAIIIRIAALALNFSGASYS